MRTRSENLQGDVRSHLAETGGSGWHQQRRRWQGWQTTRVGTGQVWDQDSDKWKKSGSERCLGGITMLKNGSITADSAKGEKMMIRVVLNHT